MLTKILLRTFKVVWTSPNTLLGMFVGLLGLMTGGGMQVRRGCVEFHGGFVKWMLRRTFTGVKTQAMTLGHSIIGQSEQTLDFARDHEHVHVRQYERWGPFFVPAYLLMSVVMWFKGKDPYRANPFEVEAYDEDARRARERDNDTLKD